MIKKFNTNKFATAKLIRSVATDDNKKAIEKHNLTAVFKSLATNHKYQQFSLMENPTLDEIASQCKVSRRDAMAFRKLNKEQTS